MPNGRDVQVTSWIVTGFVRNHEGVTIEQVWTDSASHLRSHKSIKFFIGQCEICPTTGRKHLQAYVQFKRSVRLASVRSLFPEFKLHCEARRGSHEEAIKYCSKEETKIEGTLQEGGDRGRRLEKPKPLEELAEAIVEGQNINDLILANASLYIRYHSGIEALANKVVAKRDWKTELYIYYGIPGSGKSYRAWNEWKSEHPDWQAYSLSEPLNNGNVWWDGYNGQEVIIIDDFYGWIKFSELLKLADAYPYRIQNKGGSTEFLGQRIYLTSNVHWKDWYKNHFEKIPEHEGALRRRITKCEEFNFVYA